jgi:hypothetical protein
MKNLLGSLKSHHNIRDRSREANNRIVSSNEMDMTMTSTARNISNNMITRNGMDTIKSKVSCNSKKLQLLQGRQQQPDNQQQHSQ